MKNHEPKREHLLQAASEIVLQSGVNAMTLEAVAKQANVSKGGLLYHFPNKEALIEAMIKRLEQQFEGAIEAEIERELAEAKSPEQGRWLRAYVRASIAPTNEIDEWSGALMAALSANPTLLSVMRDAEERWQKLAENDGIDSSIATIVKLACDGCWLGGLFGLDAAFASEARLQALQRSLLQLIESATEKRE
jgi:AcrR family transcriptional regulator